MNLAGDVLLNNSHGLRLSLALFALGRHLQSSTASVFELFFDAGVQVHLSEDVEVSLACANERHL